MTHPSRCNYNTRVAQELGDNGTVHLVERDKLCLDKGQWGTGDNFPESGTVCDCYFCISICSCLEIYPVAPHRELCLVGASCCPVSSVCLPAVRLPEHRMYHSLWLRRESHALSGQCLCRSSVCGANSSDQWWCLVSGNFYYRIYKLFSWIFDDAKKWYTTEFFSKHIGSGIIKHI